MKAFTLYPKTEVHLRQLIGQLELYGKFNGTVNDFAVIYERWHLKAFPGCPIRFNSAGFGPDWLHDLINYMAGFDLPEEAKNEYTTIKKYPGLIDRIFGRG